MHLTLFITALLSLLSISYAKIVFGNNYHKNTLNNAQNAMQFVNLLGGVYDVPIS